MNNDDIYVVKWRLQDLMQLPIYSHLDLYYSLLQQQIKEKPPSLKLIYFYV